MYSFLKINGQLKMNRYLRKIEKYTIKDRKNSRKQRLEETLYP